MPYRSSYTEKTKPAKKPQPTRRKSGPLTPPKPCLVVFRNDLSPVYYDSASKYFDPFPGANYTVFENKTQAKACLWHICQWAINNGCADYYDVITLVAWEAEQDKRGR